MTAPFILSTTLSTTLNAIAQASTVQIVDCLVEGTLIAIFAGTVVRAIRGQSSVTRFAVWFSALMAIGTLPVLFGSVASRVAPGQSAGHAAFTLPGSWALYLFGAWATIAAVNLAGVGRGLWHLYVLRRSCRVIDPATLDSRLRQTLERNQSPRRIALCTSDLTNVPTALGLVKPAIVIPAWVMQELSADEINQILLHEIAHLRRWDDWTNLAQKVVKALFFFHPAVWWIERKVSLEREMACDDAVLTETSSPRAYAECLAHLAEKTLIQRSIALAQAALGKIHQTSLRVAQILDADRPSGRGRSWKPAVTFVAVFAVACIVGIARAPKLIAFSDGGTSQASASAVVDSSVDAVASRRLLGTAPVVPVSAKVVPQKIGSEKIVPQHRAHVSQPKPAALTAQSRVREPEDTVAAQLADPFAANMFHLTHASAVPLAFTEALFVVVQSDGQENLRDCEPGRADQPVLQIQMWRVMILHPAVDPDGNRTPAKKT